MDQATISTLDLLFSAGFTLLGDSRDFTNSSIELILARGTERIKWTFPMSKSVVCVNTKEGGTILSASADQLSFDVVLGSKAPANAAPSEGRNGI